MAFLDYSGLTRFKNKITEWVNGIVGSTEMGTEATTLTGAIAEVKNELDTDVVHSVNGESADPTTGDLTLNYVQFADNLVADDAQQSSAEFIMRTTGGDASLSDGDAWLLRILGRRTHTGVVAEVLEMNVRPADRPAPEGIEAQLNEATFEAFVEEAGTYILSYDGEDWSEDIADYGVTVTGTPMAGDSISIYWDGEENANIYVSCYRESDPVITAVMDKDTFRSYVAASGTITLSYTTTWSADPALYGITVFNTPIDGDQIVVYYVKEDRGTITVSNPTSFVSTGWNLYNNTNGYARVLKYSDTYGFKIGGTYTGVKFSSTLTGTQTTITPDANGLFTISEDGYVWVTGGNATDTYVIMTWSDWINGYDGTWKAYSEDTINLSTVMTNFPNGLFWVNGVADEINLNMQTATSNIERLAYSAANLATAKASGRDYECDNNYIYLVREEPIVYDISVDGEHTAYDHGMEIVNGTTVPVYVETMYGYNLKDMIRHDLPEQITSLSSQIANLCLADYDATDQSIVFRSSEVASYDATDLSIAINI